MLHINTANLSVNKRGRLYATAIVSISQKHSCTASVKTVKLIIVKLFVTWQPHLTSHKLTKSDDVTLYGGVVMHQEFARNLFYCVR